MAEEERKEVGEMTVAELRARASELEITGRSSMNKDELRQAVTDAEIQLGATGGTSWHKDDGGADEHDRDADAGERDGDADADAEDKEWQADSSDDGDRTDDGEPPANEITAPSIGPNTVINKEPPEERLAKHDPSTVDAMGLDKRRSVMGQRYGASVGKQVTIYGIFLAVLAALVIGGKLAADELDKGPEVNPDKAPWSRADAKQQPPGDLDFPPSVTP